MRFASQSMFTAALLAAYPLAQAACSLATSPFLPATANCNAAVPFDLSPMAALGKQLFSDSALSASGRQSCITCHASTADFATPGPAPVAVGGAAMNLQGLRSTQPLQYRVYTPNFVLSAAAGHAVGGFMWDGRQPSLALQAQAPFVTTFEMGNLDAAQVEARLQSRPYSTT